MVHAVIRPKTEDIETILSPGRHSKWAVENATEGLPPRLRRQLTVPIPSLMICLIIRAESKYIRSICVSTGNTQTTSEDTTKILPVGLTRRPPWIPSFVIAMVIGTATEDTKAVRGPGDGVGRAGKHTVEVLPVGLRWGPAGVPGFVEHAVIRF